MWSPGSNGASARAKRDQPVEKHAAFLQLGDCNELVGLVRLIDRAGADDDGRHAGVREQPGFGAVGDLAVTVAPRKLLGEQGHLGVLGGIQSRELGAVLEHDRRLRRDRLHFRLEHVLGVVDHFLREIGRLVGRDGAEFELERRDVGHDVERRAAMQVAGVAGGERHVVEIVARALLRHAVGDVADLRDHARRIFDRVDAERRQRRMAGAPMHRHFQRALRLVADDDVHLRRLADEAGDRLRGPLRQLCDDPARADAADLLVIRECEMQRLLQIRRQHVRHRREAARHVALHVGRAAAVELAVAFGQLERIVGPVLVIDRHHVGVARQDEARHVGRPERRPQVRFLPRVVVDALVLHAEPVEILLDPGDQLEIGIAAHGVEADQRGQDVLAALQVHVGSRWGHPSCIAHRTDQGGVAHGWLSSAIHVFNVRVRRNTPCPTSNR